MALEICIALLSSTDNCRNNSLRLPGSGVIGAGDCTVLKRTTEGANYIFHRVMVITAQRGSVGIFNSGVIERPKQIVIGRVALFLWQAVEVEDRVHQIGEFDHLHGD